MKRAVGVLGLLALLAIPALHATTAVERSQEEMIREAGLIVTGRCTGLRSTWVDRNLVTLATISVSEVLKGQAGKEVTVVIPGGIDSSRRIPIAVNYPAAPEILKQEDVLLFLVPEPMVAQGHAIVGFSQGKFSLAENEQGQLFATQNLGELRLQGRAGVTRGTASSVSIDALRQQIRSLPGLKPNR